MSERKKVLYFTRYVPAYRIPVLNQLNEALCGNLVVCAGAPPNASSILRASESQAEAYERIDLVNHFFRGDDVHFQNYRPAFRAHPSPRVVLAEESPRSMTLPFLLRTAGKRGAGRVLWGIFYSVHRPISSRHPLQAYRLRLARSVEACACYARGVRSILAEYVDPAKLFVAQNTMDTRNLFSLFESLTTEGQPAVRRRLGIRADDAVLVFVGQLVQRKGTRELLEVFAAVQERRSATLLIVGDGPERLAMETAVVERNLQNVRFLGSLPLLEDSAPYVFAADVTLIPGYVGLVANHSLGLGVPVVTQEAPGDLPFHGPEVESVVDGENGFVTRRDAAALETAVFEVLGNRSKYARNAIEYARRYLSSEAMVQGLVDAIDHAAEQRPKTR